MPSDLECYVYVVLPGGTEFVTAGRFSQSRDRQGQPVGTFVYGRRYRERPDAVELDPVQLRLRQGPFETAQLGGFFGALRDALPDHWGRRVIARHGGMGEPSDFDLLLLGPDDRCGAVSFGRGVDPPAPQRRFHRTLDLERIKQAADAILRGAYQERSPLGVLISAPRKPTSDGRSWAAGSAVDRHRALIRSGGWSGRPPGGG